MQKKTLIAILTTLAAVIAGIAQQLDALSGLF